MLSLLTFFGSAAALPWLIARLPADYLSRDADTARPHWPKNQIAWWLLRGVRNLAGLLLLLAGLVMLITPGQGILTVLAGLCLMDVPGKVQLERRLAGRPRVLKSLNWIRRRAGKPPLLPPA